MRKITGILLALIMLLSVVCCSYAEQTVGAEEQLQYFYDNLGVYRLSAADIKLEAYTVADLDHNGYLELLATAVDETGSCRVLKGWTYDPKVQNYIAFDAELPEGVYNQSVMEETAETWYDEGTDTWTYLFLSELKLSDLDTYLFRCCFSLKEGKFSYQVLPSEHTQILNGQKEISYIDQNGAIISSAVSGGDPAAEVLAGVRQSDTAFSWFRYVDLWEQAVLAESYAVFTGGQVQENVQTTVIPAAPAAPEAAAPSYPTPAPSIASDATHDPLYDDIFGYPHSGYSSDAPETTTDPSLTKDPMYAGITPVYTQVPIPTEPPRIELYVTRNPTDENRKEGSTANFVANANVRDSMKWMFVSPGGSECSAQEFNALFPASSVSGVYEGVMSVSNVSTEMNGWGAYAIFYYQDQVASSTIAHIYIN